MVKLFKKDKLQFLLIFIVTNIFCAIFLLSPKSPEIDLISSLTSTNYITLILNNIYIFYMFKKAKKVKSIYDKIICRIGKKKFFCKYILNGIVDILVFLFITYLTIYLKLGINIKLMNFFIIFLFFNFINFLIQELFSMLIFLTKKGNKYIVIPVIMNLVFYYYFIPFLIKIMEVV